MHARVTTAEVQQGKLNQAVQTYQEIVLTATQQQSGYKGAILFVDRDANRAISITLWDSEEEMTGGEISPYYIEQLRKLAQFFAAVPTRESYEVPIFDLGK